MPADELLLRAVVAEAHRRAAIGRLVRTARAARRTSSRPAGDPFGAAEARPDWGSALAAYARGVSGAR